MDEPLAMLRGGTTSYYDADGLSSITSLSNGTGSLVQTYGYDSFGKQTSSSGSLTNPFQYTAREFDSETSLYFYRARYYDTSDSRFLSEDPIRFSGGKDFYEYVDNDPVDQNDPFGLCAPGPAMKECLQKIFGQPVDGVNIQLKPKPKTSWDATTRKNKIILYIPCDQFFGENDTILEEYFHVLNQWNTGRMNKLSYIWADRHGYDKNKFENEAQQFSKDNVEKLRDCLKCKLMPYMLSPFIPF
jgi:RHS repeat-associated protein